jgi:anti-sigma factor ChrR (cupin superfamily)
MITEQQKELAIRCALNELSTAEQQGFATEVRDNPELRFFLRSLQTSLDAVAHSVPQVPPSPAVKELIMARLRERSAPMAAIAPGALRFLVAEEAGWKALPIPGAFIKCLSLQADRGYAVLLGKLEPGARYPAHVNVGPEDFYILTGDLHIGSRRLGAGDFHHADAGSQHEENYSIEGCTLIAVLTTDDPLVSFAMA